MNSYEYFDTSSNDLFEIANLRIKFGQALIGLSVVAIVGSAVQGIRNRKTWPYIYIAVAGFSYLIYGAIIGSLLNTFTTIESMEKKVNASTFFANVFPPITWLLLFDTFRVITPPMQEDWSFYGVKLFPSLAATYFGYLWASIHIVIAIAFTGSLSSVVLESNFHDDDTANITRCEEFLSYGLWVFIAPLVVQLHLSRSNLQRILPTFGLYIVFIILVTIGFSVNQAQPTSYSSAKSIVIAKFVLSEVFGTLALYIAIAAGHTWTSTVPEEREDEKHEV